MPLGGRAKGNRQLPAMRVGNKKLADLLQESRSGRWQRRGERNGKPAGSSGACQAGVQVTYRVLPEIQKRDHLQPVQSRRARHRMDTVQGQGSGDHRGTCDRGGPGRPPAQAAGNAAFFRPWEEKGRGFDKRGKVRYTILSVGNVHFLREQKTENQDERC